MRKVYSLTRRQLQVDITGYSSLRKHLDMFPSGGDIEVPEGTSIEQALKMLNIPPEEAHIVLLNGRWEPVNHVLVNGNSIVLMPLLEGG